MSHSIKAPVYTQGYGSLGRKILKHLAVKVVRTLPIDTDLPNGRFYRKYFKGKMKQSEIKDYRFYTLPRQMPDVVDFGADVKGRSLQFFIK